MTSSPVGADGAGGMSAADAIDTVVEPSGGWRAASGVVIPQAGTSAERAANTTNERGRDSVMSRSWSPGPAA